MLQGQRRAAQFKGGLDTRFLKKRHVDLLKTIKIRELWVACDHPNQMKYLEAAADLLADFNDKKRRCYVMVGFDGETFEEAEARLKFVYKQGFDPFCQLYQPSKGKKIYPLKWKDLQSYWARPAAYHSGEE